MSKWPVTVEVKTATSISLDIDTAAKWFCGLSDDEQCQFFVAITEQTKSWPGGDGNMQWYYVGSHLRNCECATEEAREMIRRIHDGITTGRH
jgi:hypothetical protein